MKTRPTPSPRVSHRRLAGLHLAAPVIWALVILWLSLSANPPQIQGPLGWDKLLHAGAYALLALLIRQALRTCRPDLRKGTLAVILAATLYGGLMELLQLSMHAGRSAEWLDLFADFCGAILGCVIFRQMLRVSSLRKPHRDEAHG